MKLCSFLLLSICVSSILCEYGGVKVAINQNLIDSMLDFFFKNITQLIEKNTIKDKGILYDMKWGVEGLTRNKVILKFETSGTIYAKVSGVKPYIRGKAKFLGEKTFEGYLKDFSLELYVRVSSQQQQNGRYAPKIMLASTPKMNLNLKTEITGGILGWIIDKIAKALSAIVNVLSPLVKSILLSSANNALSKINLPTSAPIDSSLGLVLDFALASPVKLKNKFLELNSIAFLYNKNIAETKNSNRYQLTYLPEFNNMENQFQLYVSEYFLNSAIYTLIKTLENKNPLNIRTNTNLINAILPGIIDEYGDKGAQLTIGSLENSKIQLTNNAITINAVGIFTIYVDGINAPVYRCEIELTIKAKILIISGPIISGEIENISSKVTKTLLNNSPKVKTPVVAEIIETINFLFTPLLKAITKQGFKLNFPTVAGIEFKNVTLDIMDHYFVVNYNFTQGNSGSMSGRVIPTTNRNSTTTTTTNRNNRNSTTSTTTSRSSTTTTTRGGSTSTSTTTRRH